MRVGIQDGIPFGACFWKYDVPAHSVGRALHRERPVAQVRDEHRRDRAVVLEQVLLRDPLVGEQDAFRAREADRPWCHAAGCTDLGGHCRCACLPFRVMRLRSLRRSFEWRRGCLFVQQAPRPFPALMERRPTVNVCFRGEFPVQGAKGDLRMNDREHAAWQGFLTLHATLTEEIDRSLRKTHGLTLQHFEVLLHLDRAPGNRMRMGDLASSVRLSQSGASRLVDRVESRRSRRPSGMRRGRTGPLRATLGDRKGAVARGTPHVCRERSGPFSRALRRSPAAQACGRLEALPGDVDRIGRARAGVADLGLLGSGYAPGRIRTSVPRIRSPPISLRKRRFSRLSKPFLVSSPGILLPDNPSSFSS